MTSKMNFCGIFSIVTNKSLNIKIIATTLKERAKNENNNKGNDNRSCSCLFFTDDFIFVFI